MKDKQKGTIDKRPRPKDNERWTMNNGQWTMDEWSMDKGQRTKKKG